MFDVEKLRWVNRQYLTAKREDDFRAEAFRRMEPGIGKRGLPWNENIAHRIVPIIRERVTIWSDLDTMIDTGELDFFFADPAPEKASIPQKNQPAEEAVRHLEKLIQIFNDAPESAFADPDTVKALIWEYAENEGRGNVLWPLRFSLSGRAKSPDPFTIASAVGKEATIRRIENARQTLLRTES